MLAQRALGTAVCVPLSYIQEVMGLSRIVINPLPPGQILSVHLKLIQTPHGELGTSPMHLH
jgi:hypothetical protein